MEGNVRTGAPHRCLRVADIQTSIFNSVPYQDCISLAITCTSFYEQAMNIIWADVRSLIPFVKCMPPDVLVCTKSEEPGRPKYHYVDISFSRELTPVDWHSFCKHIHRVRTFVDMKASYPAPNGTLTFFRTFGGPGPYFTFRLSDEASSIVSRFICQRGQGATAGLFPKLSSLFIPITKGTWVSAYIPYLGIDTLQMLEVKCDSELWFESDDPKLYIDLLEWLPTISARWPNLSSIHLKGPKCTFTGLADGNADELAHRWFKNLRNLRSIQLTSGCHWSLIRVLSELPTLQAVVLDGPQLGTFVPQVDPPLTPLCPESRFPKLRDLTLRTFLPDSPVPFLRIVGGSQSLIKLSLTFRFPRYEKEGPSTVHQAPMAFEVISQLPALEHLDVTFENYPLKGSKSRLEQALPLDTELFSTLFKLHHLRHLALGNFPRIQLRDRDLYNAVEAWPQLEHITISLVHIAYLPNWYNLRYSLRMSLAGIQVLYNGCPNLKTIELPLNDRPPVTDRALDLPAAHPRGTDIEVLALNFHPSRVDYDNDRYMWMVIRLMFPQVKQLKAIRCDWDVVRLRGSDTIVQSLWEKHRDMDLEEVRKLLAKTVKVRS